MNNAWYDAAGRTIKSQPPGSQTFTKTVYDGLGRTVKEYTGYNTAETGYPNPGQFVTDDTILEQAETTYDPAGHEILITIRSRLHDATGKGELTAPDGVQPRASVYYAAMWYDAAGRQTALADYGTNGGKPLMRVALAPAASDTVLVTSTEFDAAGRAVATIDPKGRVTQMKFDATGRAVATVQNYVQGGVGANQNITTQRTYTPDGAIATLTAVNPTTGNQVTRFIYGTSAGGAVPLVCRNDLLRAVIYPDSTNYLDGNGAFQTGPKGVYNRVEYTYNRQGQRLTMKDQNGTIHQYVYDPLGRQTQDQVIVLGTGVDGAVRRVARSYEVRGMVAKLTSYDAAAGGNVVNEVLRQYDALGRPVREYQEHRGAASSKSLSVQHNYADLATCGGRLSSIRYPNGRLVDYAYTSAAGASLSRPDAIAEDNNGVPGNTLSRYTYLGLDTIVAEDYPQPQVKLDYLGSASGRYAGFDNFGRVVQQLWQNYGTNQAVNQFRYGYDRASNRTWRQNVVSGHLTPPAPLDEFYTNDGDDRLIQLQRGTLNLQKTGVAGTPGHEEGWTLDATGNWPGYVQKTRGRTALEQTRTHNEANELLSASSVVGAGWATASFDLAGNMTTVPKPSSLANGLTLRFDAWNHLVQVADGPVVVAKYQYDGDGRRIAKLFDSHSPGRPQGLDSSVDFYHAGDQEIETRAARWTTARHAPRRAAAAISVRLVAALRRRRCFAGFLRQQRQSTIVRPRLLSQRREHERYDPD